MSDEVQTTTPETQQAAPVPPVIQAAAPAVAAPGDAPPPVAAPVWTAAPAAPQLPVAPAAPAPAPADPLTAALASAGAASEPVDHETLLQRAHDELDRIIHRIVVGLDKGVEDLRSLKNTIAAHLGL